MSDLNGLEISGRVARPGDPDWDQARAAWNLAADQNPEAVAFAESAEDIVAVVRFAAANDLRVAAQGTGHGAVPLPPLDGTILLKTERMRGIEIDPRERIARIEAGVLSAELAEAAGEHGLSALPGSSPDVGVVGSDDFIVSQEVHISLAPFDPTIDLDNQLNYQTNIFLPSVLIYQFTSRPSRPKDGTF